MAVVRGRLRPASRVHAVDVDLRLTSQVPGTVPDLAGLRPMLSSPPSQRHKAVLGDDVVQVIGFEEVHNGNDRCRD